MYGATFYLLQHPLLQVASVEAAQEAADFSAQQFALQLVSPLEQQSQVHVSHKQTPDSQQQPPSGQQLSQAQALDSVAESEELA